jgi:hypothetical protein
MKDIMMLAQLDALAQECLRNCTECHDACLQTSVSEDVAAKISANDLRLLLNCAEICRTSADFLDTMSSYHRLVCAACAQICQACAQMCREAPIETMHRCADVCDRCADSCRRMAAG